VGFREEEVVGELTDGWGRLEWQALWEMAGM
jgi:hypothetical protein